MVATKPVPIRIDDETLARLDKVAAVMSQRSGGAVISRSNVLRVALDRGLHSLEKELAVATTTKKKR